MAGGRHAVRPGMDYAEQSQRRGRDGGSQEVQPERQTRPSGQENAPHGDGVDRAAGAAAAEPRRPDRAGSSIRRRCEMPEETKGTGEKAWSEEEKSRGAANPEEIEKAGGSPQGRPNDDRAKTESAAAQTERDKRP